MGISKTEIRQCFKVLELDPNASLEDVQKAFRILVKIWHPDLYTGSPQLKKIAEENLKKVNAAYAAVKSYLALRKKIVSKPKVRNSASSIDRKKENTASATSGSVTGVFSDPFAWLRNRNPKWFQGEYAKKENQPLNSIRRQTTPRPKINRDYYGKDFKQVLQEVVAASLRSQDAGRSIF